MKWFGTYGRCRAGMLLLSLAAAGAACGLPPDYTRLAYVESTGTQYIDTGVLPTASTELEIRYQLTELPGATTSAVFGYAGASPRLHFGLKSDKVHMGYNNGADSYAFSGQPDLNAHTVTFSGRTFCIDGTAVASAFPSGWTGTPKSLCLFAYHQSSGAVDCFSKLRLFSCAFTALKDAGGNTVSAEFIPCKDGNGTVGLYETVSGAFLGNAAGGDGFTAGPAMDFRVEGNPAEYGEPSPGYGWVKGGHEPGATCTFNPPADGEADGVRWRCRGWEFVTASGVKTSGTGTASFAFSEPGTLTWLFTREYKVEFTCEGGDVNTNKLWYAEGEDVTVTFTPAPSYVFYKWAGDVDSASRKANPLTFAVDGPKAITALTAAETHVSTKEGFATALADAQTRIGNGEIGAMTIWLADGDYQLTARTTIDVPIRIRGESDDPTKVVFSPDKKSTHEMFVLAHADAVLSGLTVQGGYGTGGQSYSTYGGAQGADVTITSAGGTVENCILRNATGDKWGACAGGLKQGGGLVSRCVISNCSSSCAWGNYCSYGNAALVYGGVMENTLITKNSGGGNDAGGGAICLAGTGKMINCTVAGNAMNGYAGIFIDGSSAKAINCLICNNTSYHRTEGFAGVYNGSSVASCFTACVAPVQINGSCFTASGLGLKDAEHGDYHPILGSVCLDNGTLDGITQSALDLDGNVRVDEDSGKIDVGCYELVLEGIAASVTCTPADKQGLVPLARTFSSIVQGGTPTAYEWSVNGDVQPDETEATFSRTFTKAGSYRISLRVSDAKGVYDAVNDVLITALPTNVYVDATSATPVAPYDTPETAAKTFADAYAAAGDYSVILVAPKTYERTSQITISKKVTVRGTGKSPLDTILSLKNVSNVRVLQLNCKEALVCNLTLDGGRINGQNGKGAGVYIADKGGAVSNCVIRNCKGTGLDTCGGGAYLGCADALITHSVFTNCAVFGNTCGQNPGARGGYAVSLCGGSVRDSLIVGCYQDGLNKDFPGDDGAVAMHGGKLVNCTIVGCRAEECAGIRAEGGQVINCIVSGNTTTSTNPTNAVWRGLGTTVGNSLADLDVDGKFAVEPATRTFKAADRGDFRLRVRSLAVDAGTTPVDGLPLVDLFGNPRVRGKAVDIGCGELQDSPGAMAILR